jgi:collagenase-like PrtC family protease
MTDSAITKNKSSAVPAAEWFRIVAPVNRPDEVELLAQAGASEIYCGVLPPSWAEKYGDWDSLSRRQGNIANLTDMDQLSEIAKLSARLGIKSSLALNVNYSAGQILDVIDLARAWEQFGGTSVIASNLGILLALQKSGTKLACHVSILANVTNSKAVAFYRGLGVVRTILPRELTLSEIEALISKDPDMEYEAMAMNEKCRFIDGLCGFYHGTAFPNDTASIFTYVNSPAEKPVLYAHDLCYAGHGCQIQFENENGQAVPRCNHDDENQPACAACSLTRLRRSGLRFLKIGGRGLPVARKLRSVSFLRNAVELQEKNAGKIEMRSLYKNTFGQACSSSCCYYNNDSTVEGS